MAYEYRGNTLSATATRSSAASASRSDDRTDGRSLLQVAAGVFGLVFLLVGIAGFVPGLTQDTGRLELFGTDSHAELLGIFRVSVLHNVVHALFGIGLLAAARASWSAAYLIGGGIAYGAVAAYGFAVDQAGAANFLPINHGDNWLHLGLMAAMVLVGLAGLAAARRSTALR